MKENEPTAINQHPIPSEPLFKCQKCQHDSIDDKELNGFDVDDVFHDKTSFSLETLPQRDVFIVKVWIVFSQVASRYIIKSRMTGSKDWSKRVKMLRASDG